MIDIAEAKNADMVVWLWEYQNAAGQQVIGKHPVSSKWAGVRSPESFVMDLYNGSYENGCVVGLWNKLYRKASVGKERFRGYYNAEDEDWITRVCAQCQKIFCVEEFGYVYAENNDSLTKSLFSERRYAFLEVLRERTHLFIEEVNFQTETRKLYLNIYIEYFYAAQKAKIAPYRDKRTYLLFLFSWKWFWKYKFKDRMRFIFFVISPSLYQSFLVR